MRLLPALLCAGLACFPARAADDPWTPAQVNAEIAFGVLMFGDLLQTMDIAHHPGMRELNKILGPHPSDLEAVLYFATTGALQWWLMDRLPSGARDVGLSISVGLEGGVNVQNIKLGLQYRIRLN